MLFSCLVVLLVLSGVKACSQDSDCGNPEYFDCVPNGPVCTLIDGIAVVPHKVYWLERCVQGSNSTVYLIQESEKGEKEVAVIYEDLEGLEEQALAVKYLANANFRTVYTFKSGRFSNLLTGVTETRCGFSPEFIADYSEPGIPIDVTFESNPDNVASVYHSYVCLGTQIVKYNTLTFNETDKYKVLYNSACTYISFYDNHIYWATTNYNFVNNSYQTAFYRGSTTCNNCSTPTPFASLTSDINEFGVGHGRLYFARPNMGIEYVRLGQSSLSNTLSLIPSGNINSFKLSHGSRMWLNNGLSIQWINVDGSNLTTVYATNNTSVCKCASGFSGSNCTNCTGQVQVNNGVASCVPYDGAGFPSSCYTNSNCGNTTFTACNQMGAICECVTGAQGIPPLCDTCENGATLEWSTSGIPFCP